MKTWVLKKSTFDLLWSVNSSVPGRIEVSQLDPQRSIRKLLFKNRSSISLSKSFKYCLESELNKIQYKRFSTVNFYLYLKTNLLQHTSFVFSNELIHKHIQHQLQGISINPWRILGIQTWIFALSRTFLQRARRSSVHQRWRQKLSLINQELTRDLKWRRGRLVRVGGLNQAQKVYQLLEWIYGKSSKSFKNFLIRIFNENFQNYQIT